MTDDSTTGLRRVLLVILALLAVIWVVTQLPSCSSAPQISPENRDLLGPLKTAIAAENAEWLEVPAKEYQQRHEAGAITNEEFAAIDVILQTARDGEWKKALALIDALMEAQSPTADDLANVENLKVLKHGEKGHQHGTSK